jgi:hypothetical protein
MEPKKLWIGAEWQAERDHYGLDKRCGMFSTERFHEDDVEYTRADLPDALAEAAEKVVLAIDEAQIVWILDAGKKLKAALAAYRGEP